jgi:molybdopterin synthase catalytic subunit
MTTDRVTDRIAAKMPHESPEPQSLEPQADHFLLTDQKLDLAIAYTAAANASNGAVVLISGMVRNQTGGRQVAYLDYQAYAPMAMRVFKQIAIDIRTHYPDVSQVVIHHRLGKLVVGEISVIVAVGSPHRAAAFAACQYGIDTLKDNAPIWKKEYWQDGDSTWVNMRKLALYSKPNQQSMTDRYYFGYGSNIVIEGMQERCPGAILVGNAELWSRRFCN